MTIFSKKTLLLIENSICETKKEKNKKSKRLTGCHRLLRLLVNKLITC